MISFATACLLSLYLPKLASADQAKQASPEKAVASRLLQNFFRKN